MSYLAIKPKTHGVSYGSDLRLFTRYAEMPAVLYGPAAESARVLDGRAGSSGHRKFPSKNLGMDVARDARRALDLLVERCTKDATCHEEFPDLARDLDRLMAVLQ
jgi:hypothetical protein